MLPEPLRKSLTLKTPPAFDVADAATCVLALKEAKTHCRVDWDDDDSDITGAIATATGELDGAEGLLGRALLTQSWELRAPGFGVLAAPHLFVPHVSGVVGVSSGRIKIPLPPLRTIDYIKFVDVNGVLQTIDPAVYQTIAGGVGHAWIAPAYGQSWPAHRLQPDAVQIGFTAGYGAGTDVPAPIKSAVKIRVRDLYDNRNDVVVSDSRATLLSLKTIDSLLSRYVISWF